MSSGKKFDAGKPRMELLPRKALEEVAKVLGFGAEKYDAHNWRGGFDWSRLYGSILRHVYASLDGEDLDPESGIDHMAHAACGVMFLLEHKLAGMGTDDRYKQTTEKEELTVEEVVEHFKAVGGIPADDMYGRMPLHTREVEDVRVRTETCNDDKAGKGCCGGGCGGAVPQDQTKRVHKITDK